jgi:hypothetical protein
LRLSRNLRTPGNAHLHIDSLCFYYSFVLVDDRIECKFTFIILHSYFVFPCMCQKLVRLQRKSRRFSLHFVAAERPYVSSLQNRSTTKTAFCYHKPCESVGVRFFVQPFLYHHALHVLRGLFFFIPTRPRQFWLLIRPEPSLYSWCPAQSLSGDTYNFFLHLPPYIFFPNAISPFDKSYARVVSSTQGSNCIPSCEVARVTPGCATCYLPSYYYFFFVMHFYAI